MKLFKKKYDHVKFVLYEKCSKLPLSLFIDVLCNQNYKALTLAGEPSQGQLLEQWDKLYQEYLDLSGSRNYTYISRLENDLGVLRTKLKLIHAACLILQHTYSLTAVNSLLKQGYKYEYSASDYNSRVDDLRKVLTKSKVLEIVIAQKQAEKANFMRGFEGKKPTEQHFISTLIILSKHQGYDIQAETTSVAKYLEIKKQYEDWVKEKNKQALKNTI